MLTFSKIRNWAIQRLESQKRRKYKRRPTKAVREDYVGYLFEKKLEFPFHSDVEFSEVFLQGKPWELDEIYLN